MATEKNNTRSDMMPVWTDAYLADTTDLDAIQHGFYYLMMIRAWRDGGKIKNDERVLTNVCRTTLAKWRAHSPAVLKYWKVEGEYLTQKRLSKERKKRDDFIDKQSERGKKSAEKRQKSPPSKGKKPNENNKTGSTKAEAVANSSSSSVTRARAEIIAALENVCGEAVDWQSPDIAFPKAVLHWIEGDDAADFELDVIPAMEAICKRRVDHGDERLRTWNYFRPAVFRARDDRLRGNPKPDLTAKGQANDKRTRKAGASQALQTLDRRERRDALLERRAAQRSSSEVRDNGGGPDGPEIEADHLEITPED